MQAAPYLFISPWFLLFFTFAALPLVHSVWISLYDTVGLKSRVFAGLDNYRALGHDPLYGIALKNSAYFALGTLVLQLPVALALAMALNSPRIRFKTFFRFAFFSPVLIAGVFIAIIFGLVLNLDYGLLNNLLASFGINTAGFDWLKDDRLVMPSLILCGVWRWSGFNMIYFLAGLQSIRQELYEAAAIDGAGPVQSFLQVTLPGLRPMMVFVLIMSMMGSLQVFDLPYILLSGAGPNNAGLTAVMYLYQMGFQYGRLGYAAAIGWTLFAIIFAISMLQMRVLGKPVEA